MKMHKLAAIPFWDWPLSAATEILAVLKDQGAEPEERLLAAELAGTLMPVYDDLAEELIQIIEDKEEDEALRGRVVTSLGAALDEADLDRYQNPIFPAWDEPLLPSPTFDRAREALRSVYEDLAAPELVRRMALEAGIRFEEPWHTGAVRTAYHHGDPEWRITAVFCMRWVEGFSAEILDSLETRDPELLLQAVLAIRDQALREAWPNMSRLVKTGSLDGTPLPGDEDTAREILFAAIQAVAIIRPLEAPGVLSGIIDSEDEDLSEVALQAVDWVHGMLDPYVPLDAEVIWH